MGGVVVLGGCWKHLSGARCFFDWVDFTSTGGKWGYGNIPDAIASQTKSKKPPLRIERRLLFEDR